jgi:hypothetical protein
MLEFVEGAISAFHKLHPSNKPLATILFCKCIWSALTRFIYEYFKSFTTENVYAT